MPRPEAAPLAALDAIATHYPTVTAATLDADYADEWSAQLDLDRILAVAKATPTAITSHSAPAPAWESAPTPGNPERLSAAEMNPPTSRPATWEETKP